MSEMIKNSDVEDVLFSIKRLVSETPSSTPDPESAESLVVDPAAEKPSEAQNSDALFLTSSLRVNDPETEPEQIDLEDMTTGLSHFRNAVTRDVGDKRDILSLDDMFAVKSEGPRRLHLSEVVSDVAPKAVDVNFEDEQTESLTARKWSDDPDVARLSEFATEQDTFGAPADVEVAEEVADEDTVTEDKVGEDFTDQTADAELKSVDEAEEFPEDNEDLPRAMTPEPEEDLEAGAADGLADFDENILDEDALRDMVTEIVRQELSGELGERITRNVRKLVRREIHRALMAREFD